MKLFFQKIKDRFSSLWSKVPQKHRDRLRRMKDWFGSHPAATVAASAFTVAFFNEILSRRSLTAALAFLITKPVSFLSNAAIVLVFLSFALLFKRKRYMIWFFSLFWLGMGITNFVVRCFRATPFSSMDFTLVKSVFPILPRYLTWPGLIAVAVGLLLLFAFLAVLFFRAKRTPVRWKQAIFTFLSSVGIATLLIGSGYIFGIFPHHFSNLAYAYNDHGFTFCFSVSLLDRGIDKPDDYDNDKISEILSDLESTAAPDDTAEETYETEETDSSGTVPPQQEAKAPNVIFVQLESFYDPKYLKGFTFSEDPTPVFSSLREEYQSGLLTVPSIGAGTANTEFEVLAGMSLQWFGAGEYPYETILQKKTCETLCYNLKNHGYKAHAVHNYKGNFYDRSGVFSHLGFDTFTSLEYMNGVEYNDAGWAKDAVLLRYIKESLLSSEESDLVYCITVQGHGKYPTKINEDAPEPNIDIEAIPEGLNEVAFTYYVNQLHETDAFIGALLSTIKSLGEESYVVLFGDHLPNIGIGEELLPDGMTLYDTEYVIWHSEGETAPDKDLKSYQLSAALMSRLDCHDGVLTKLHQTWADKEDYLIYLEMIQYDVLYGQNFCYGGENPFLPTDLKMGILDITVTDVTVSGKNTYVIGTNFTPASRVYVNGFLRNAQFVDETTLLLEGFAAETGDVIRVAQVSDAIFQLSSTEDFVCP